MDNVDLDRSVPIDPVNDYDISRLNKNELMLMYNAFRRSKGSRVCDSQAWHTSRNISKSLNVF